MKYIASLTDLSIAGSIEFFVDAIVEAKSIVRSRGTWLELPGTGKSSLVLLSEGVGIQLHHNPAPYTIHDNATEKFAAIHDPYPEYVVSVGPRGGVRVERA